MTLSRLFTTLMASAVIVLAGSGAGRAAGQDGMPDLPKAPVETAGSLSGAYLAAKTAQASGDLDAATDYYTQALSIDPTAEALQQDAMFAYLADGRFKDGVDLAAKLRDDANVAKVARITLGVDALTKGDFEAAIAEFDVVNPTDLDALLLAHLMAWAEVGAGRVDEALSRIDQSTGAPWYAIFNAYQKGLIASLAGRPQVARKVLSDVVADQTLARTSPDAYLGAADALARLETREGDKQAALKAVDAGLAVAPNYTPLTFLRDRIDRGETIEPAAASVQEGAAESLYVLGQAINRGDGRDVALLYFQLARALSPRSPALLTALAGIAEQANQLDLAISYYKEIPENSAFRRTADLQIGLDLWYAEKKDEAKRHLERAVRDYPDDVRAHTALADVLSADKQYAEAAGALDKAVELAKADDAENWNLYYQRGIAYERQKMWDKAEPDFKKALELSPDQPQVLNYLGYSWVDMNRHLDEGLGMIKRAVDLRPNDGYIIDSLGWAYYRLGRYDDAVEQLERAVLITPMDPTINDHLGDAYWQVGRKREAKFQWERALVGKPEPEAEQRREIEAKLKDGLTGAASSEKADTGTAETPKRAEAEATSPTTDLPAKPANPAATPASPTPPEAAPGAAPTTTN
ncbi:tetratricopeptide repeat protein [Jiella avicenniae]|uniref:Tetratricopeptide repeat protein n=2 Tax=Jiella avicenniae TaxID=2907202 RepID=A0A9X1NZQ1_9HYPH|nr:tetratricopeptide repeat protein [Jiella avicenniae]MCE7028707.1 tetratricopeptide repeat protein [Jiella avicenniae]